jgi:hypothetical protein
MVACVEVASFLGLDLGTECRMGLFGRKRGASNRVAEGGGGGLDAVQGDGPGPPEGGAASPVAGGPRRAAGESLELFGDDSDASDDDAAIARCLEGIGGADSDGDTESRKVSVLTSKASALLLLTRCWRRQGRCDWWLTVACRGTSCHRRNCSSSTTRTARATFRSPSSQQW